MLQHKVIYYVFITPVVLCMLPDITTLSCFDVELPEDVLKKWKSNYEQYRKDMGDMLKVCDFTSKSKAANDIYNKYKAVKVLMDALLFSEHPMFFVWFLFLFFPLSDSVGIQELYGASELQDSPKTIKQLNNEALAIYRVTYDHAMLKNEVSRCGFAWKVAGSILLQFYASKQDPAVLWREIFGL